MLNKIVIILSMLILQSSYFLFESNNENEKIIKIIKKISPKEYKQIDSVCFLNALSISLYYTKIKNQVFVIDLSTQIDVMGFSANFWNYQIQNDSLIVNFNFSFKPQDNFFFKYEPKFFLKEKKLLILKYDYRNGIIIDLDKHDYKEKEINDIDLMYFQKE